MEKEYRGKVFFLFFFFFLHRNYDKFGGKTSWDKVQDKDRSLASRILVAGKIKQG